MSIIAVAASKSAEKAGERSMNSYVDEGRQPAKHLPRGKVLQRRANRIATTLTHRKRATLAAADALVTCLLTATLNLNWTAPVTRPHINCSILATCKMLIFITVPNPNPMWLSNSNALLAARLN
eukprot:scaffold22655_cov172-Skeletonema_dohrnii-CCMP3373.AAC.1